VDGVGRVAQAVIPALGTPPAMLAPPGTQVIPKPGARGTFERLFPGGETGYMLKPRRRMDPLNVKALRRAGRRVKGFLRIAGKLGALPVNRGKGKQLFKRKRRAA